MFQVEFPLRSRWQTGHRFYQIPQGRRGNVMPMPGCVENSTDNKVGPMGRYPLQLEHEVYPTVRLEDCGELARSDLLLGFAVREDATHDLNGSTAAICHTETQQQQPLHDPTVISYDHKPRIPIVRS